MDKHLPPLKTMAQGSVKQIDRESSGASSEEINAEFMEKFGESNPEVSARMQE